MQFPLDAKFLCFDFGLKRIGSAVGQNITKTASPLTILKANHGVPNWEDVECLLSKWSPSAVVIGEPLNMDGTQQDIGKRAKYFATQIENRFNTLVYLEDERLSTVEVKQRLFDTFGYRKLKNINIDSYAAAIILEQWMTRL